MTCTVATTNWSSSSNTSATDWKPAPALTGKPAFRQPIPRAGKPCLSATWWTAARAFARVLQLVMDMVSDGVALCVAGNHESKLLRKLQGRNVQVSHGLAESLAQLELESPAFRQRVAVFLDGLISHYVLDEGGLVVAHAGMKEEYQGRASARVRDFCLYGETTGETDEFGLPVRYNWAAGYRGSGDGGLRSYPGGGTRLAQQYHQHRYGLCLWRQADHAALPGKKSWYRFLRRGSTMNRRNPWPRLPSRKNPLGPAKPAPQTSWTSTTCWGKRIVATRLRGNITVREENSAAALEVMSRFALDPRWLVYLPPTISPCDSSRQPGMLEHPTEVFHLLPQ